MSNLHRGTLKSVSNEHRVLLPEAAEKDVPRQEEITAEDAPAQLTTRKRKKE